MLAHRTHLAAIALVLYECARQTLCHLDQQPARSGEWMHNFYAAFGQKGSMLPGCSTLQVHQDQSAGGVVHPKAVSQALLLAAAAAYNGGILDVYGRWGVERRLCMKSLYRAGQCTSTSVLQSQHVPAAIVVFK